jgi:hypothetical protein
VGTMAAAVVSALALCSASLAGGGVAAADVPTVPDAAVPSLAGDWGSAQEVPGMVGRATASPPAPAQMLPTTTASMRSPSAR